MSAELIRPPISHSVLVTLTALVRQFLCQLVYDLIPLGDVDASHVERALANRNLAASLEWDVKSELLIKTLRRKERAEAAPVPEESSHDHHDAFPFSSAVEEDTESDDDEADDEHVELEKAQEEMDRAMSDAHEETLWGRRTEADISGGSLTDPAHQTTNPSARSGKEPVTDELVASANASFWNSLGSGHQRSGARFSVQISLTAAVNDIYFFFPTLANSASSPTAAELHISYSTGEVYL